MMRRLRRVLQGASKTETNLPVIAVAGALRSGTNYLKFLLEQNYAVTANSNVFGWKHAGVPVLASDSGLAYPDVPLAYIVKNPYSFVVSLSRYHQRRVTMGHKISIEGGLDFASFLTSPVTIFDSQLVGTPQLRFANPVQYWNFIYWNLEKLDTGRFRAAGFNYEDLICNPDRVRGIEAFAKFRRHSETLATPENQLRRLGGAAKPTTKAEYQKSEEFDAAYYAEKRYLDSFSSSQLAFMRAEIDPWLMTQRGYETI